MVREVSLIRYYLSKDLKDMESKLCRYLGAESFRQREQWVVLS